MTVEQLVEIFIKPPIFDSSRAICVLIWGQNKLFVPSGWGKARKTSKISQDSFPQSHWIDQKRRQKISESYNNNMPKAFSRNTYFMSNLHAEKCHFTCKSTWDQAASFASFVLSLVWSPTRLLVLGKTSEWKKLAKLAAWSPMDLPVKWHFSEYKFDMK